MGMGVAAALALGAKSTFDRSSPYGIGDRCLQPGVDLRSTAVGQANVATVVFGVSLAVLAGSAVVWLAEPPKSGPSVALGVGFGAAAVRGNF